jgi:hypothetical protein
LSISVGWAVVFGVLMVDQISSDIGLHRQDGRIFIDYFCGFSCMVFATLIITSATIIAISGDK